MLYRHTRCRKFDIKALAQNEVRERQMERMDKSEKADRREERKLKQHRFDVPRNIKIGLLGS